MEAFGIDRYPIWAFKALFLPHGSCLEDAVFKRGWRAIHRHLLALEEILEEESGY